MFQSSVAHPGRIDRGDAKSADSARCEEGAKGHGDKSYDLETKP